MTGIAIVLHTRDKLLLEELAGTTEVQSQSGLIRYHPPVRDRDHRTDSLRACIRAIQTIQAERTEYGEFDLEKELGWMDIKVGGFYGY